MTSRLAKGLFGFSLTVLGPHRELDLAPRAKSHPERMTREQASTRWMDAAMDDNKRDLHRLGVHDDAHAGVAQSTEGGRQ